MWLRLCWIALYKFTDRVRQALMLFAMSQAFVTWLCAYAGSGGASRWMGHHSAAYTLDVYGHLIDAELAPTLDLHAEFSKGSQCHPK